MFLVGFETNQVSVRHLEKYIQRMDRRGKVNKQKKITLFGLKVKINDLRLAFAFMGHQFYRKSIKHYHEGLKF